MKVLPLLVGSAIVLSACATGPGYAPAGYASGYGYPVYDYPAYGSLQFDYWSGWGGDWDDWHRHWDRDDWHHR